MVSLWCTKRRKEETSEEVLEAARARRVEYSCGFSCLGNLCDPIEGKGISWLY